jgi:uncharacterized protein (TIRG00374 family)
MAYVKFALRVAVAVALMVFLFKKHEVDFEDVLARLKSIPLLVFLGALAIDLAGRAISALRWSRLAALAGRPFPFRSAWSLFMAGTFFNTCLPSTIGGDTVRIVGFSRHTGSKSVAFASVFMDRNVGMAGLLTLGLVSALAYSTTLRATLNFLSPEPLVLPMWPFFVLLITGFAFANMVLFRRDTYALFERLLLCRAPAKLQAKVRKLFNAMHAYRLRLTAYLPAFLLALTYQVSEAALLMLLAWGLGLKLSFWAFGAMVTFQAVAGLLPITINNIGVRDSIFCAVLIGQATVLGQNPDAVKDGALALAWLYLGVVICAGLVGGLVYMAAGMTRPTEKDLAQLDNGLKTDEPAAAPTGK